MFDTFIGILIAIALPMMFFSLLWGIYSIGDTATLGNIGNKVIGRYFGRIYFTLVVCTFICLFFFPFSASGGSQGIGEFQAIFAMLLSIIPSNIIAPFAEGNTLQIIFLAVVFGLERLGISTRLVNFGVPLGTAFSRPGHAAIFFCVCMFMANYYGVSITPSWVFMAILTCGLLALAVPPVPGGGIACYSILFLQLGIPVQALGIAAVLEILLDFLSTALNMVAVPIDMVQVAAKLDMLDEEKLKAA